MGLRVPPSPEPPKVLPRQGFPLIELAGGQARIRGMENQCSRDLVDRHVLDVSKPFLEALRDETDLGQMETSLRVAGVDSENSLQEALGAIHALRTPFELRLEQQLVALHRMELPGSPVPPPLRSLFLFRLAPSLIGHLRSRGQYVVRVRSPSAPGTLDQTDAVERLGRSYRSRPSPWHPRTHLMSPFPFRDFVLSWCPVSVR
ncbi:MAG: hypothetical protein A3H97_07650 [Acidobacteria bacterium RIFCSPLOWO2_02_FULL_65_29]|nr:MAG: hypothetical protein A3H97_07650 [Acidobacteria bacterium RIFCSPLOWO2_02_FULL_65_29]